MAWALTTDPRGPIDMPSPIGHLLGGAAIYLGGNGRKARSPLLLGLTLASSVAPDLDFVPGLLSGDLRAFHHGISHSLGFALLFGVLIWLAVGRLYPPLAWKAAIFSTAAYFGHALLDCAAVTFGRGVPLLWPLSGNEWALHTHLFGHFRYGSEGLSTILRWTNVGPVLRECLILGALVALLGWKEEIRDGLASLRRWRNSTHD